MVFAYIVCINRWYLHTLCTWLDGIFIHAGIDSICINLYHSRTIYILNYKNSSLQFLIRNLKKIIQWYICVYQGCCEISIFLMCVNSSDQCVKFIVVCSQFIKIPVPHPDYLFPVSFPWLFANSLMCFYIIICYFVAISDAFLLYLVDCSWLNFMKLP